jgi:protein-tyrosine-phosphatase
MAVEIFNSSRGKKELKVIFVSKRDQCRAPIADSIFSHLAEKFANKAFNKFLWRSTSCGLSVPPSMQARMPEEKALRVICENHLDNVHGSRQVSVSGLRCLE